MYTSRPHTTYPLKHGFTLLELLVVMGIIGLLIAVTVPTLIAAKSKALTVLCVNQNRVIALNFSVFADEYSHGFRGDSEALGNRFDALDWMERSYQVGEFAEKPINEFEIYEKGGFLLSCPAGPAGLGKAVPKEVNWKPAVNPRDKVHYAMNRRLFVAPIERADGSIYEMPVSLGEFLLSRPSTPLIFDVDAEAAMASIGPMEHIDLPFFGAPYWPNNDYWFPSKRHQGKSNVLYIDGRVETLEDPLKGHEKDWLYHPPLDLNDTGMRKRT